MASAGTFQFQFFQEHRWCDDADRRGSVSRSDQQQKLLAELEGLPEEYFPLLLQMIRTYRESVLLKPAADSFQSGWEEAQRGETLPVERLWEGIDAR